MGKYSELLVKNILKILHDQERNQAWLAKKTKTTTATLSRLLNGEHSPNLETLEAIEKGLNLNPGDLLRKAGPAPPLEIPQNENSDLVSSISVLLPSLNQRELERVLSVIESCPSLSAEKAKVR